jgi:hypothetical protein
MGFGPSRYRHEQRTDAHDIADLYRQLRRGREQAKNEPGAADFYYGEMEMRRMSDSWFSRMIIAPYWAISGHGLRPLRAFATFAAVVLLAAWLFRWSGFKPSTVELDFGESLQFSLQSAVSFFRAPTGDNLTWLEQWLQLALRFVGPVLLGLALLAIRARVKR